jgi:DNA end-binding protein Ku
MQPLGKGILLTILRSGNEVVPASQVFGELQDVKVDADMIEVASMLIDKKVTRFDPSKFEDHYEEALQQLLICMAFMLAVTLYGVVPAVMPSRR